MIRIAQERLVAGRQHQLLAEADKARFASRVHRPELRVERRFRNPLSLRAQFAR
jgi:hypothetical protein